MWAARERLAEPEPDVAVDELTRSAVQLRSKAVSLARKTQQNVTLM